MLWATINKHFVTLGSKQAGQRRERLGSKSKIQVKDIWNAFEASRVESMEAK